MSTLNIENLSKKFVNTTGEEIVALEDISLEAKEGEFVCVLGPSGCGKSTLLRMVAGLDRPSSGRILLGGNEISGPGQDRGMVFQEHMLFPWRTAIDNVAYGLEISGFSSDERRERAMFHLKLVGIEKFADAYPKELSGGMKQRVGIARALALNPEILVADEPVSALDVSIQAQILSLLDEIRTKMNLSMVFITHDLRVAAQVCDRLAVMRYGEIVETGATADIFDSPQHSYTRDLLAAVPGQHWER